MSPNYDPPEYETSLSRRPPPRKTATKGRLGGVLCLLIAAGIVSGGMFLESESEPLRVDGSQATGVLESFEYVKEEGYFPEVRFTDAEGATHVATAHEPMFTQSARLLGKNYEVFYAAGDPPRTFIEGIDPTLPLWPFYAGGGVMALFGLLLLFKPQR